MIHTRVRSIPVVFVMKIIYILFWTYILNLMCKDGHREISWFLVLIPFILLFSVAGMTGMTRTEAFTVASQFKGGGQTGGA